MSLLHGWHLILAAAAAAGSSAEAVAWRSYMWPPHVAWISLCMTSGFLRESISRASIPRHLGGSCKASCGLSLEAALSHFHHT